MIAGYVVVRYEMDSSDRIWVCLDLNDALTIARDVSNYWIETYGVSPNEANYRCEGDVLFNCDMNKYFRVFVYPMTIREKGESAKILKCDEPHAHQ